MAADEVEVLTRKAGTDQGTRWKSKGEDEFTVEDAQADRGTRVVLHLKPDAEEFAEAFRLKTIVRKYSDHIGVPVVMPVETADDKDAEDKDEGADAESASAEEVVNAATALWTRSRSEVKDDEYKEFYKHVSHDFEDPLAWSHNRVEGRLEYTSLVFIPRRAPFDLWNRESPRGLKLYVQRVFIMDDAEQFLPLYLRFVRGIVDSNDLPLNVSREILQQDPAVTTIKNALAKRVLDSLTRLDGDDYGTFWDEFGQVLKEGVAEDFANREAVLKLLRFSSTEKDGEEQRTSLSDYVDRMQDGQKKIYYLIADSLAAVRQSPHLEVFKQRGIEVLLLTDRIDEWFMSFVNEFDDKPLQDITRGELDLDGEDKKEEGPSGRRRPGEAHQGRAGRPRRKRAPLNAAHRIARVSRPGRARHGCADAATDGGHRAVVAGLEAALRIQPRPSPGREIGRRGGRGTFRRSGQRVVRPGQSRRGPVPRRSRRLRPASEFPAARTTRGQLSYGAGNTEVQRGYQHLCG